MKITTRAGGAVVAGALVIGGAVAYAQTNGVATAARASASPSVSSEAPTASATPSTSPSVSASPTQSASPSPTVSTPSTAGTGTGTGGGTSSGTGGGLVLSASQIGPVSLPAKADAAVAALTPILGKPDQNRVGEGCKINGTFTKTRVIAWGDKFMISGPNTSGGQISSWLVYGSKSPVPIEYPYGVGLGATLRDAQAKIPGAVPGEDVHGYPILSKDGVTWSFDDLGSKGKVNAVNYYALGCD